MHKKFLEHSKGNYSDEPNWFKVSLNRQVMLRINRDPSFNVTSNGEIFSFCDKYICKYDAEKNKFHKYVKLPDEAQTSIFWVKYRSLTVNKSKEHLIIYFREQSQARLHMIAIKDNVMDSKHVPRAEYVLFIDGHIHLINNHNQHKIGYKQNNQLVFKGGALYRRNVRKHGAVIYVPSKDCIILIGGHKSRGEAVKDIAIFSRKTQTWSIINDLYFNRYNFGIVLSPNERYILLFGGSISGIGRTNDISILDIKTDNKWKLRKSKICCPRKGKCVVTKTPRHNNKIIVIEYIKQCYKTKKFKQCQPLPLEIISMIYKWYSDDQIHYFHEDEHFVMNTKMILSNMY